MVENRNELPSNWAVRGSEEFKKLIGADRGTNVCANYENYLYHLPVPYFYISSNWKCIQTESAQSKFIEISLDDFKRFVMGIEVTNSNKEMNIEIW